MSRTEKSSGVFDNLDKEMEKSSDERFLRLEEDGDRATVFFAGEPFVRYVYWDGQQTREWTEGCGQKKNLRVAMNVIICNIADGKLEVVGLKVLEQGKRFFQNVSKRDKKYGIHNWVFEVERSGSKGDTDTTYDIDAEYKLSEKEQDKLSSMKLIDLEDFYDELSGEDGDSKKRSGSEKHEEPESDDDDSDEVIGEAQRKDLVALFKTMDDPEGAGRKFCEKFGIDKVKNLPKSKLKKALGYMDKLLGKNKGDDDSPF